MMVMISFIKIHGIESRLAFVIWSVACSHIYVRTKANKFGVTTAWTTVSAEWHFLYLYKLIKLHNGHNQWTSIDFFLHFFLLPLFSYVKTKISFCPKLQTTTFVFNFIAFSLFFIHALNFEMLSKSKSKGLKQSNEYIGLLCESRVHAVFYTDAHTHTHTELFQYSAVNVYALYT